MISKDLYCNTIMDHDKFIQFLTDMRKEFNGPILVEIDDDFDIYIESF